MVRRKVNSVREVKQLIWLLQGICLQLDQEKWDRENDVVNFQMRKEQSV